MYKSTITVKGQTTIPLDIRKKLNLSADDNIEYYTNDNNTVTILNSNLDIHDLCGILSKPSKVITIEEMKKVINKRRGESDTPNIFWYKEDATQNELSKDKYMYLQQSQQRILNIENDTNIEIQGRKHHFAGYTEEKVITNRVLYNTCRNTHGWYLRELLQ